MNDHDRLRADALLAACVGKQDPDGQQRRRAADRGMPLAGKSTLDRVELSKAGADSDSLYCKIVADLGALADLPVEVFLDVHHQPPGEITLDSDVPNGSYPYRELFGDVLGNLRRAAAEFAKGLPGEPDRPVAGVAPGRLAVT